MLFALFISSSQLETVSPEFEQFLSLLGEKFEVLGWQGYKGDLDVKRTHVVVT